MRKDTEEETVTDWLDDGPRMRDDAMNYVAPELADELQRLINGSGRKDRNGKARKKRVDPKPAAKGRKDHGKAEVPLRLAAAE